MAAYALLGPRWPSTTITWSFADPARRSDGGFSGAIGGVHREVVLGAVQSWAKVSGLTLQQVDDTVAADVRIGWGQFGTSAARYTIGETAYSYFEDDPFVPGVRVRLQDPSSHTLVPDADGTLTYARSYATLRQVALHKIGHALGLGHSDDADAVLYPVVQQGNQDLSGADIAGIRALYPPSFLILNAAGRSFASMGTATDGAVDYLRAQYIHAGAEGVSIGAAVADVFIKGGAGDDALAARSGRNVLDGGRGSNFLVGGTGVDTYFIDGRGGQITWGTVVGFEAGEIITLWGFDPAVSRLSWVESQGAAGYQGRTLHADLDGDGAASALVTVAGADAASAGRWALTTGSDGTNPYLAIINLG